MGLGRSARRWLWRSCPQLLPQSRRALLTFYGQFVAPGDLCFEVGAHRGGMTEMLLILGGRVVAVEPQAACVTALKETFADVPQVSVVGTAVGSAPAAKQLMIGQAEPMSSLDQQFVAHFESASAMRWTAAETVEVVTLDALIEQFGQPKFLRLDIEGSEPDALAGLSRPVDCLSFEFLTGLLDHAARCVGEIDRLAASEFNYSTNETRGFDTSWISGEALLRQLAGAPKGGHVYARPQR